MRARSLVQKDLLEKEIATHFNILAWRNHGQRSLAGYSPEGHTESGTTESHNTDERVRLLGEFGLVEAKS